MRTTIVSLAAAGVCVVAALAAAPSSVASVATHPRGTVDRVTSTLQTWEAPYGDPVPITVVVASGTIKGCRPGAYFTAWVSLEQDGVQLSEASGALGVDDATCGADGTVVIRHGLYSPHAAGLPHPGRARATLHAEDPYGGGVLIDVTRWVTIPG